MSLLSKLQTSGYPFIQLGDKELVQEVIHNTGCVEKDLCAEGVLDGGKGHTSKFLSCHDPL